MATIREKKKDGKIVSFSFTACLGRDLQGKQIRRYFTWIPPEGLTPSKAKKAAEKAAVAWEKEIKAEELTTNEQSYALPAEQRRDDFVAFVNDTWYSLFICNGDRKPTTVAELELRIIRERVRSGMANAKAKGAKIGRPQATADDIPAVFLRHYPAFKNKQLNVSELARVCDLSRTTVYKYLCLLESRVS